MRFQTLSAIAFASAVSAQYQAQPYPSQTYPAATYPAAQTSPAPVGDKCASECTAAFNKCKAQPNENNSFCVSQYAGCLGFNPFAAGAPAPTACVKGTSPPAQTYPGSQPTPSPPAGDKCSSECTAAFDKCKAQPGENNSFCVSQYAGCLGYNPFAAGAPSPTACIKTTKSGAAATYTPSPPPSGGDKCAADCGAAFDKCKAQPGENNSFCVSQYAGCLGFNPFAAGAPATTACMKTTLATYPANPTTYPANPTTYAPNPTTTPSSPPPAGGDQCSMACTAAFDKCKAQPNENNSFCVSQYAGCLGYNPFAAGAPSPTACISSTPPASPPATPTGKSTPTPSQFSNDAGSKAPVMGLLAVGLLAML